MTKQTNSFQQLVHRIHTTCAGPNTSVVESFLEPDPDGVEREVDVLVEEQLDEIKLRTAIECRDHRRKSSIEWVDQVVGKYNELKVDRVILVNRRGYSESAVKKATRHGIQLWTLTELSENPWPEGLPFLWLTPYQEHVTIDLQTEFDAPIPVRPGARVTVLWHGLAEVERVVREQYQIRRELESERIRSLRPTLKHLCDGRINMRFSVATENILRMGFSYESPVDPHKTEWVDIPRVRVHCGITAKVWIPEHKRHFFSNVGLIGAEPAKVVTELALGGKPLGLLVSNVET